MLEYSRMVTREETDAKIASIREHENWSDEDKQLLIDDELTREGEQVRAGHILATAQAVGFMILLIAELAIFKYFVMPLLLL